MVTRERLIRTIFPALSDSTAAVTVALAVAVSLILSGGPARATTPSLDSPTATMRYDAGPQATTPYGAVIVALTGPRPADARALLPDSFHHELGYRPPVVDGYPVDPTGDCSSPVPLPDRFTILCATHDFGYDVLRAAAHQGTPLGPWARFALDRMLIERMRASCNEPVGTCVAAAQTARIALAWNSWRQRGGPPIAGEGIGALISTSAERAVESVGATAQKWWTTIGRSFR